MFSPGKLISLFDALGPVMISPSSSATAGAFAAADKLGSPENLIADSLLTGAPVGVIKEKCKNLTRQGGRFAFLVCFQ